MINCFLPLFGYYDIPFPGFQKVRNLVVPYFDDSPGCLQALTHHHLADVVSGQYKSTNSTCLGGSLLFWTPQMMVLYTEKRRKTAQSQKPLGESFK